MRSLAFRIGLVVGTTLLLFVLIAGALRIASLHSAFMGAPLPEPKRVGAIADLVESTPPSRLPQVLRAIASPQLDVSVRRDSPRSIKGLKLPRVTPALAAYRSALHGRPIRLMLDLEAGNPAPAARWKGARLWTPHAVRFAIGLRDGRTLVLETHSEFRDQFTGLRISMLALISAIVVGALALLYLRSQLRPVERLAAAVQRFGTNMEVSALPEEGAQEIRQLTAAFNRLQSQITSLIAGRTRMMAAISHDLGTYLTRLRLRADYVADVEQRSRTIRDIEDMHALMTDTLAIASLDHDGENVETIDLSALAKRIARRHMNTGGDVIVHAGALEVWVKVRPSVFGRVFDNLISNALKYGHEAEITVSKKDGMAEVLVDDRGPGIPENERETVLEPFYRRDASRNLDEGGFGLGLAIVADIVRRHAGTLILDDRPDGGLRAKVRIPLAA